jgi:hypothetical protein
MKEIFIYGIAAVACIAVLGYSVHILIGGLVSAAAEHMTIIAICLSGIGVIFYMVWDVIQHRRDARDKSPR